MNARLPILLTLALGAAACRPGLVRDKPPPQDPAFVFPHATHVDSEVACAHCHPIEKATRLQQGVRHVQVPANASQLEACSDCHDTDPPIRTPVRQRPFRFTFSHANHLPLVGGDCTRCHVALTEPGDVQPRIPPMATCTSCHNHQQDFAEARCTPCHTDLKGYVPQTAFRHEGDWLRSHGALARPSAETCVACHDQTYCAECHSPQTAAGRPSIVFPERVDRAFIHRGDYVSRHMIDASANPASCRRCHGSAYCGACHEQQGLSRFAPNFRDPHPAGWALGAPGQRPPHANAARRDIVSCAGCHDQGAVSTCVACHQEGGAAHVPGRSPHPAKFRSKHNVRDIVNNDMCLACHRPPFP
jgi:hypothetical protein